MNERFFIVTMAFIQMFNYSLSGLRNFFFCSTFVPFINLCVFLIRKKNRGRENWIDNDIVHNEIVLIVWWCVCASKEEKKAIFCQKSSSIVAYSRIMHIATKLWKRMMEKKRKITCLFIVNVNARLIKWHWLQALTTTTTQGRTIILEIHLLCREEWTVLQCGENVLHSLFSCVTLHCFYAVIFFVLFLFLLLVSDIFFLNIFVICYCHCTWTFSFVRSEGFSPLFGFSVISCL